MRRSPADRVTDLFAGVACDELRECIREDLEALTPEELAGQFRETRDLMAGLLLVMGGSSSVAADVVLGDAHRRASEALRRAEGAHCGEALGPSPKAS
ncbi:MAG: hypothetical protein M3R38_02365 [Actinomycetota bacterium]|nr:hypothetical protein [Actinomycetota bacterium]